MKKAIIHPEKFEKLSGNSLTYTQLLMVKGGGNNPPTPGTPDIPPPDPAPDPNNPGQ
jgi:hypothetical protein